LWAHRRNVTFVPRLALSLRKSSLFVFHMPLDGSIVGVWKKALSVREAT
jgi:hypothetical protein